MNPKELENLTTALANLTTLLAQQLKPIPPLPRKLVCEVACECLDAKAKAGLRRRYLQTLKCTFGHFTKMYGEFPISEITGKQIEDWLNKGKWSARTRRNYLVDIRTLLAFAKRRGYVGDNVAANVEKPVPEPQEIGTLSLREVWRVLEAAHALGMGQYIGVMLFAGLRPEEADRLTVDDLREENLIVRGHKSKTRRRRTVPILPALAAWLEFCGPCEWPPPNRHRKLKRIHQTLSRWPHDALRNCFVSYALPVYGASKVALWAGHSEDVLFASYAEIITEKQAKAFWGLYCDRSRAA